MQIGFSQPVEIAWMEATAALVVDGLSIPEIRERLDEMLSQKIAVNSLSKRSSRNKRVTILMTTWVSPKHDLVGFRDYALTVLRTVQGQERTLIHFSMLIATYPFISVVAGHVGRLLRLQDHCSMEQLKRRCREDLGQRDTVSFAVTRVIRTLIDWGLLAKRDRPGIYSAAQPIEVSSVGMVELLTEAALIASDESNALAETILGSPCLFPCLFTGNTISLLRRSTRLLLTTSEYGGFRVSRTRQD